MQLKISFNLPNNGRDINQNVAPFMNFDENIIVSGSSDTPFAANSLVEIDLN